MVPHAKWNARALALALGLLAFTARATSIEWASGTTGSWHVDSSWTPMQVPGSEDDVSISAPATETYFVSIAAPATANSLVIDAPVRALLFSPLDARDIDLRSGTLEILGGGLTDATVHMNGGSIVSSNTGGTFSNVTVDGDLTIGQMDATTSQQLIFTNSTSVTGTLDIQAAGMFVYLGQSGEINNPINITGVLGVLGAQTITISPSVTMQLNGGSFSDLVTGDANVTNLGTITGSGGLDLDEFTNLGTINVQGSGYEGIRQSSFVFTNGESGVININSGRYWIQPQPTFINRGVINIGPEAILELYGGFYITDLGEIRRPSGGGTVLFRGRSFVNDGNTLALDASTGDYFISGRGGLGVLSGGRVTQAPGGSLLFGKLAALSGVEVEGDLNLTSALMVPETHLETEVEIPELHLLDGSTFTGSANLTVPGAQLLIDQNMTSENRFELAGSGTRLASGAARTLNLGAGAVVNMTGSDSILGGGTPTDNDILVNQGLIHASPLDEAGSDASARISAADFTNLGTVEVSRGELIIDSLELKNLSNGVLSGGTWEISNSTLTFERDGSPLTITENRANVVLSGPASRFDAINSLTLNDVGSELHLLDGRDYHSLGEFVNAGLTELDGGTFDTTRFGNSGKLLGYGAISGDLINSGLLSPRGQLDVNGVLLLDGTSLLDINLEGGSQFDYVNVAGDATIGGFLSVTVPSDIPGLGPEDVFTLVRAGGVLSGGFNNVLSGGRIDVGIGSLLLTVSTQEVTLSGFMVPEPSVLTLLCILGLFVLLNACRARWGPSYQMRP